MKNLKKLTALLLSLLLAGINLTPVIAEEDTKEDTSKKEESVYVLLNSDGSVSSTTVSEWLHDDNGVNNVNDISYLNNIKNTKSDAQPTIDGSNVTWNTSDHDVYYQGTSNAALPISMNVVYKLDGVQMNPEDIIGKSGTLQIDISIQNNTTVQETINGKSQDVSVLFPYMLMLDLSTETYSDVKAEDGIIASEGKNQVVGFVSVSGLDDALNNIDINSADYDDLKDKVKNDFTITTHVEEAEIPSIMLMSISTSELETGEVKIDKLDELEDGVSELKDAMNQILDGSNQLKNGATELNNKMGEFQTKYGEFNDGVGTAASSQSKIVDGSKQLQNGLLQLQTGLNSAMAAGGSAQIAAITQQLTQAAVALNAAQQQMVNMQATMTALASLPASVKQGLLDQETTLDGAVDQGVTGGLNQYVSAGGTAQLAQAICGANAGNVQVNNDATASGSINEGAGTFYVPAGQDTTSYYTFDGTNYNQAAVDTFSQQDPTMSVNIDSQSTAQLDMAACVVTTQAILDAQLASGGSIQGAASAGGQTGANTAYEAIADGTEANLNTQMVSLNQTLTDANTTITQMLTMIQSFQTMVGSMTQLTTGLSALQPAVDQLYEGSKTLTNGTVDMQNGLNTLHDKSGEVLDVINQFKDATTKLSDAVTELDNGVNKFSDEGINELSNKLDDAIGKLNDALDVLDASKDMTKSYTTYAGAPEGMNTTVKFIMKTQSIKIDENQTKTTETADVEETTTQTSFWDRIKNLISFN